MIGGVVPLAAPAPRFRLQPPPFRAWLRTVVAFAARRSDEASVLARAQAGDHHAFAEIVFRHDEKLRGLAFRLLGDRDRMDDVLQEAYVRAFRALPKFKGTSSLATWLYRITYNACIDDLRRRPEQPALSDDRLAAEPSSLPDPSEVATSRHDLAAALATLPVDQRAAVLLVDAYGFDYAEAAEVLGVRSGTIASRLNRARTALRRVLGDAA